MSVCRNYECIEWQQEPFSFLMFSVCIFLECVFSCFIFLLFVLFCWWVCLCVCVFSFAALGALLCAFAILPQCRCFDLAQSFLFGNISICMNVCVCASFWLRYLHLAGGNYCLDVMYILLLVILSLLLCITRDAINSSYFAVFFIYIFRWCVCMSVCFINHSNNIISYHRHSTVIDIVRIFISLV